MTGFSRDAQVGFLVGTLDVAMLWPFVVLASRREAGSPSLSHSLKQGKLWSGGSGAVVMLVPYSIIVESLSNYMSSSSAADVTVDGLWQKMKTVPLTSLIIALGLQPIEKKLVMDSLLQTVRSGKGPLVDIANYTTQHGVRRLYGGFLALWARETIYVSATMVLNPLWTSNNSRHGQQQQGDWSSTAQSCAKAFMLGFSAGMISAPCQTLSVMGKDERRWGGVGVGGVGVGGEERLTIKRLFYGSLTRSLRTGAAGVLWFMSRKYADGNA